MLKSRKQHIVILGQAEIDKIMVVMHRKRFPTRPKHHTAIVSQAEIGKIITEHNILKFCFMHQY